jgi:hypothetical protein
MTLKTIKNLTELVILKNLYKRDTNGNSILLYKLSQSWVSLLGKNLADRTQIFTIQNCNEYQKQIVIKLFNPSEIHEFNNYKLLIQQRINTFLGEDLVTEILFMI